MLIDWFTVCAQIVNFLILVWLLKIFLYKPVLQAIANRQNEIAAQLQEAKEKKEEADKEFELYSVKNCELDKQKEAKIKQVNGEVEKYSRELLQDAKTDIELQKAKWQARLETEKEEAYRDISLRVQKQIFAIAKKAISDLAESDLDLFMVESFLKRLPKLPAQNVRVFTAKELPDELQEKVKAAIHPSIASFSTSSELVAGIELVYNGQKISWNIADYLASLEKVCQ